MRTWMLTAGLIATLSLALPAAAQPAGPMPVTHDEIERMLGDLAGQLQGLGQRFGSHFGPAETPPERPLITIMLEHREDLGLSAAQVQEIERLRGGFERQAIKLDADRRIAQMDLASLLRAEPVELDKVEAKVREIERLRADLRIGRIRAIEQAKAQLTKEQRTRLVAIAERAGPWPRLSGPPRAPAPERF